MISKRTREFLQYTRKQRIEEERRNAKKFRYFIRPTREMGEFKVNKLRDLYPLLWHQLQKSIERALHHTSVPKNYFRKPWTKRKINKYVSYEQVFNDKR